MDLSGIRVQRSPWELSSYEWSQDQYFFDHEKDLSISIPKGIKKLSEQLAKGELVEAFFTFPRNGSYREYDLENSKLYGQKIVRTKTRGVEPGFIAIKVWSLNDRIKLLNENHKFHKETLKFLHEKNILSGKSIIQLIEDDKIYELVKTHLVETFPKFNKIHYWKLHYAEPSFGKNVRIDYAQSRGPVHTLSTSESRRDKNLGALMEVLSNEVFNILEFGGQKLNLRLSKYKDGHPMFLVDGTHVAGPDGEKFKTLRDSGALLEGPNYQGRIKDNMLPHPEIDKLVPLNERQLGSALLKCLLMGDRDKVGPAGDNLGYVVVNDEAILMNIDPGKSCEEPSWWKTDRMSIENDIRTDCSFDQVISLSDQLITGGYKNYSIFTDTPLVDKMHGMRDIIYHWSEVEELFGKYIDFLKTHGEELDPTNWRNEDIPMYKFLEKQLERLTYRKKMFERVLGNRLKFSDDELNLLDNLEKLTSSTRKFAEVNSKCIELKYLQIINPNTGRTEFDLPKDEKGGICPRFSSKNAEHREEVIDTWNRFRHFLIQRNDDLSNFVKENIPISNGEIFFIHTDIQKLLKVFSQSNIIDYKDQRAIEILREQQQQELDEMQRELESSRSEPSYWQLDLYTPEDSCSDNVCREVNDINTALQSDFNGITWEYVWEYAGH